MSNTAMDAADENILKALNTAFISTRAETHEDPADELCELMKTPAFKAILLASKSLAQSEGLSEQEAASTLIKTFRRADRIWRNYVFQEGIQKLKGPGA